MEIAALVLLPILGIGRTIITSPTRMSKRKIADETIGCTRHPHRRCFKNTFPKKRYNRWATVGIALMCFLSCISGANAQETLENYYVVDLTFLECYLITYIVFLLGLIMNIAAIDTSRYTLQGREEKLMRRICHDYSYDHRSKSSLRYEFLGDHGFSVTEPRINERSLRKLIDKLPFAKKNFYMQAEDMTPQFIKDNEYWIDLFEDITFFLNGVGRVCKYNQTGSDLYVEVLRFVKSRVKGSLTKAYCDNLVPLLIELIESLFEEVPLQSTEGLHTQSFDFQDLLSMAEGHFATYKHFTKSKFYTKMHKLFLCMLSLSIFEKAGLTFDMLGYTQMEKEALKMKFDTKNVFETFIESALFICRTGHQIYQSHSLQPIIHSEKTYLEWADAVEKIKNTKKYFTDPSSYVREFGEEYNESEFCNFLDETIEKGDCIAKYATNLLTKFEISRVFTMLNEVKMIRMELFTKTACRAGRKAPYSILIYGESGHCKSTFQDMLYFHFCKLSNLDPDVSNRFCLNPFTKHMDGLTRGTHTILIDDLAAKHPDSGVADATVDYVINLINNVPYVAPMADLADKGKVPFRGKLVIGSTNIENLNAHKYFAHPSAMQRRFPYIIIPTLKPEYYNVETKMVAQGSLPDEWETNSYPDLWDITVKQVLCGSTKKLYQPATLRIIKDKIDLSEFLLWFNQTVKTHNSTQNKAAECSKKMQETLLCDCCQLPIKMCTNVSQQSFEDMWPHFRVPLNWALVFLMRTTFYFGYTRKLFEAFLVDFINAFCGEQELDRIILSRLARDVVRIYYPCAKYFAAAAASLSAFVLYKKFFGRADPQTQGQTLSKNDNNISKGTIPTGDDDERENVWYQDKYELSPLDLGAPITSSLDMSKGDFSKLIAGNCVFVEIIRKDDKTMTRAKALCLGGHTYVFNTHMLRVTEDTYFKVVHAPTQPGVDSTLTFKVVSSQIKLVKGDISLVHIPNLPAKRKILKFLPEKEISIRSEGYYLSRDLYGKVLIDDVTVANFTKDVVIENNQPLDCWVGKKKETETKNGDCGSALILQTVKGPCIAGIHYAGDGKACVAIALTQELLLPFMDKYMVQAAGMPYLSAEGFERNVADLNPKSVVRFIPEGTADVMGSFTGFRPQPKSKVCNTPMSPILAQHDYKVKYAPPVMSGWQPKRVAALDLLDPVCDMDQGIIDSCVDAFVHDILEEIPKSELEKLAVYDDFTVINGASKVTYVDKINRASSAGNPYKKSKNAFLNAIPPQHDLPAPVEFTPLIMDRAKDMEKRYAEGKRCFPNYGASFKDEPVSEAKRKAKKTRVFTTCPVEFTINVRKYFLSFIRLIQTWRFAFEAGVGTIAQSVEWQKIYHYLTTFGLTRIICGDYKSYDKRMPPAIIFAAFQVLIKIGEASGQFTQTDILIMCGIAEDTTFPLVDYFGDLIMFYGSNPSGHPLTVIINSIANSLYMRYCYFKLNPANECVTFKQFVKLVTYGDDNIMGVSEHVPWFNHTSIARVLRSVNITYTMADKESESIPYIHIRDATFLKRSWRYDADVGAYTGPLEHDSIEKMLMTWVRSKSISWQEQSLAVISSANMEYFWYGKHIYAEKQTLFRKLIDELNLRDWMIGCELPSWDELNTRFWSYKTQSFEDIFDEDLELPGLDETLCEMIGEYYSPWTDESINELYAAATFRRPVHMFVITITRFVEQAPECGHSLNFTVTLDGRFQRTLTASEYFLNLHYCLYTSDFDQIVVLPRLSLADAYIGNATEIFLHARADLIAHAMEVRESLGIHHTGTSYAMHTEMTRLM